MGSNCSHCWDGQGLARGHKCLYCGCKGINERLREEWIRKNNLCPFCAKSLIGKPRGCTTCSYEYKEEEMRCTCWDTSFNRTFTCSICGMRWRNGLSIGKEPKEDAPQHYKEVHEVVRYTFGAGGLDRHSVEAIPYKNDANSFSINLKLENREEISLPNNSGLGLLQILAKIYGYTLVKE